MKKLAPYLLLWALSLQPLSAESYEETYDMKDNGTRHTFSTGAIREVKTGKGRYDLISPIAMRRLADNCELSLQKYPAHDWEKGFPFSSLMDSAMRHLNQYREGFRDEDHLVHAMWNVMAMIHFEEAKPELNDLPSYETAMQ